MLGALLSELLSVQTIPFPDDTMPEMGNEDPDWYTTDDAFDNWLLQGAAGETPTTSGDVYY